MSRYTFSPCFVFPTAKLIPSPFSALPRLPYTSGGWNRWTSKWSPCSTKPMWYEMGTVPCPIVLSRLSYALKYALSYCMLVLQFFFAIIVFSLKITALFHYFTCGAYFGLFLKLGYQFGTVECWLYHWIIFKLMSFNEIKTVFILNSFYVIAVYESRWGIFIRIGKKVRVIL